MALPFTIRDARPADVEDIVVLGKSVNISTFGKFVGKKVYREHLEEKYSVERVRGEVGDGRIDFVVATTTTTNKTEEEEKIIGFAVLARGVTYPCLEHLEDIIELQRIYIYPEFHGRGVGKALMGELEGRARREGRKNIWLGCYENNDNARKVYEKAGFVRVGERVNLIDEQEYLDWIMVKRL